MVSDAAKFTGSIPDYYNRELVPILFEDYAEDMAGRVAASAPSRVLELAAGTGVLTRALRGLLPPQTSIIATDLNAGMLDLARTALAGAGNVRFEIADALELPFPDQSFDAVACQFGVMFFPDKARSYQEVMRVLAPGGRYFFNVWDSMQHNDFARVPSEVLTPLFGGTPPAFYAVPTGYSRLDPIRDALEAAGFVDFTADVRRIEKPVPNVGGLARGLIFGNPTIAEIDARPGVDREEAVAAVTAALRQALGGDPGRTVLQAIVISARRP